MIEHHFVEQGSEEWHQARENKFTGSNAYKLLSSPNSPDYARTTKSTFTGNYWTRRGHALEVQAIQIWQAITKIDIIKNADGMRVGYVTNSKYPNCLFSPDILAETMLAEIKCFDTATHLELMAIKRQEDIPLKIMAQVQYGLLISELQEAHLIAYNPSMKDEHGKPDHKLMFNIFIVKRNPAIQRNFQRIIKKVNGG